MPALSRSATEPTARPGVMKRATFPNLPGLTGPPPPNLDDKTVRSDQPKRRHEGTDSESRSSSHLSKRRKYSTEPSETYNLVLSDPSTGLKALNDGLKLNGMIFYPDALAKASENFRNMSLAYVAEKASRKETFEAALKRATRRANEADHKFQDASQQYADRAKVQAESHAKTLETLRAEIQTIKAENAELVLSEAVSREALKTASESPSLRNSLLEKEEQLAMFDHFRTAINTEIEQLTSLHASATAKAAIAQHWQQEVSNRVNKFNDELEDMGMKTIKRCGTEIQTEVQSMVMSNQKAKEELEKIGKAVEALCEKIANGAMGIGGAKEVGAKVAGPAGFKEVEAKKAGAKEGAKEIGAKEVGAEEVGSVHEVHATAEPTRTEEPLAENNVMEKPRESINDHPDEKITITQPSDTPITLIADPFPPNTATATITTSNPPTDTENKSEQPQDLKEPVQPVANLIVKESTGGLKLPWL